MLPKGLNFSAEQLEAIDEHLNVLRWETEAKCVLLADITGQFISQKGDFENMNTAVLSALAAGELSATKEMAKLVGETARFKLLLHEGERQSVYLSDIDAELILVTVFNNSTPIGLVRMVTRQVVEQIREIAQAARLAPAADNELEDDDFAKMLVDQLDGLSFGF